jgi:adenylyl-sulfate kinase
MMAPKKSEMTQLAKSVLAVDSGSPEPAPLPKVLLADRMRLNGHRPAVLWFTGLSGSGKSTLANAVEVVLHQQYAAHTFLLDGDVVRTGLNKDLGFTAEARTENIRRIGEVARLFYEAGLITLAAFISPFRADRDQVRALFPPGGFFEIYVRCPLEVCEQRDPKRLYQRARAGQVPAFTGIDSPYEAPLQPELTLDTAATAPEACVEQVVALLENAALLKA